MAKRVRGGEKYTTKGYGNEYKMLYQTGNIKFVRNTDGSATAPMFTQTQGRVYVTVNADNNLKSITYYDKNLLRYKQIDLDHYHYIDGVPTKPHKHKGLIHYEKGNSEPSLNEKKMIDRVTKTWYNFLNKK